MADIGEMVSALWGRPTDPDSTHKLMEQKFGPAPPALRLYAQTLAGDRSKITEDAFKPDELERLRGTAETALGKGKSYFGYGDYGEKEPFAQGTHAVYQALTDPAHSLAFTLGMANVKRNEDGSVAIKDRYHFSAKPEKVQKLRDRPVELIKVLMEGLKNNGLLGVGNVLGNLAVPQTQGRDVEIKFPPRSQ